MKKILSIIFCGAMMLAGTNAFAQLSVGAGYLNDTFKFSEGDFSDSFNSNGFYAGAFYNFTLAGNLSLNPGLYFSYLTGDTGDEIFYYDGKCTEMSLNVPLNFRYNLDLASDTRLFVYAGPTFQYGLSAKFKPDVPTIDLGPSEISAKERDLYDDDFYSRGDIKLGGGVGFELFDAIQVTVGYKYGLLNRVKDSDGVKIHHGTLNFGVAYLF
ncbi:MAG: PorT family protein [Bacteroidales bacterium]|nr:PorT family protein [Bacteroidales bacterium]MBQ4287347.1 PorT family protein [Bacteroidales bacterium]